MLCWVRPERQERPQETLRFQREIRLPAQTSPHLLQPCLSCIKIFQLSALKLQLNRSNLRLSQEQRAVAALQQTPLTT